MVRVYGSAVPGSASRPNACVSVKLPSGVADDDSLACRLKPSVPRYARTPVPTRAHPPLPFCQRCNVAVVLPVERAVTVITWVALPVGNANGNRWDAARGAFRVGDGGGGDDDRRMDARGRVLVTDDDVGAVVGAVVVVVGVVTVRVGTELGLPGGLEDEQPPTRIKTLSTAMPIRAAPIGPGCHATPMRILGWVEGRSQRMSDTSFDCEIDMHPAVGPPSVTCRKNALPLPARTPPGALRVLASMTTA